MRSVRKGLELGQIPCGGGVEYLRVVGGDEKGSLQSALGPENDCAGEGQQQL
jgi:hypothetical protein